MTVRIVPWLFKFGPQGTLTRGTWDSDYCQLGAWEHARWKYLTRARSVQNSDIDELVVSTRGRSNFAAVENDPFGMLRYTGRWIVGTNSTAYIQHHCVGGALFQFAQQVIDEPGRILSIAGQNFNAHIR